MIRKATSFKLDTVFGELSAKLYTQKMPDIGKYSGWEELLKWNIASAIRQTKEELPLLLMDDGEFLASGEIQSKEDSLKWTAARWIKPKGTRRQGRPKGEIKVEEALVYVERMRELEANEKLIKLDGKPNKSQIAKAVGATGKTDAERIRELERILKVRGYGKPAESRVENFIEDYRKGKLFGYDIKKLEAECEKIRGVYIEFRRNLPKLIEAEKARILKVRTN